MKSARFYWAEVGFDRAPAPGNYYDVANYLVELSKLPQFKADENARAALHHAQLRALKLADLTDEVRRLHRALEPMLVVLDWEYDNGEQGRPELVRECALLLEDGKRGGAS